MYTYSRIGGLYNPASTLRMGEGSTKPGTMGQTTSKNMSALSHTSVIHSYEHEEALADHEEKGPDDFHIKMEKVPDSGDKERETVSDQLP